MGGTFIANAEVQREQLDWGELGWVSNPPSTGAEQLVVIDVTLEPGFGHDFHKHPQQEEVIWVREGRIEQWLDRESRTLGPGDAVFIPPDLVHGSYNPGAETARLTVVLGPCVGQAGYELVDVAADQPWASLRA